MGRYIQWNDVADRYPDVAAGVDANIGNNWIVGTENELDARLASRYTVPFTPAPPMLKELCIDYTYARINLRQEEIKPIYDSVIKRIEGLIDGTIVLIDAAGAQLGVAGAAASSFASNSYRSAFGPDDPVNWTPSESADEDAKWGRFND